MAILKFREPVSGASPREPTEATRLERETIKVITFEGTLRQPLLPLLSNGVRTDQRQRARKPAAGL